MELVWGRIFWRGIRTRLATVSLRSIRKLGSSHKLEDAFALLLDDAFEELLDTLDL